MKKNILTILALLLTLSLALAGCKATAPQPTDAPSAFTGDTKEILSSIIENAKLDFEMFDDQVNAENCESYTGLAPDQMSQYVADAYASMAAMNVNPHLVVLIKCVDAASASTVKGLVADGFDSNRWVCVMPDQSLVVDSGAYVLLVSSRTEAADAVKGAFLAMAGDSAGEVDTFFTATAE